MKITNSGTRFCEIYRSIELELSKIKEIEDFLVNLAEVEKIENGNDFEKMLSVNEGIYVKSKKTIFINIDLFANIKEDSQKAVLAHEIAHAYLHKKIESGYKENDSGDVFYESIKGSLDDCIPADILACRWGFFKPLSDMRVDFYTKKHGEKIANEYFNALAKFNEDNGFVSRKELCKWDFNVKIK